MIGEAVEYVYDLMGRGEWQRATAYCRELLQRRGKHAASVHHALGLCLCHSGELEAAADHLAQSVALEPFVVTWSRDAGALYAKLGRWEDSFEALVGVADQLDEAALVVLMMAAVESNRAAEALTRLSEAAVATVCAAPIGICAYGKVLIGAKHTDEAEALLRDGVARWPRDEDLHETLAEALDTNDRHDEALEHVRTFADLSKHDVYAQIKLALAYLERGQLEAGRDIRKRAQLQGLIEPVHHAACLYLMLSDPEETGSTMLPLARQAFSGRVDNAAKPRRRRSARSRLRVGYIGGPFHLTPSYYFTHPILSTHDRSAVEVFLYCSAPWHDEAAPYYKAVAEHFRPVAGLGDNDFSALLKRDALDVAIHTPGFFGYSKLWVLCDRVAPVQASYPEFPGSTGCPGIDYLITDRWTSPTGTEDEYSERLCRVPTGYLAFNPPVDGPPISASRRRRKGSRPVFGIFQRLAKFNDHMWDAVADLLSRVPDASLLIHNGDAELYCRDSPTAATLASALDRRGIDPARLRMHGPLPYHEHLEMAGRVDVALDTFPYGGQTTTFESLWMGVPVVTLAHPSHAGRVSAGILGRCGHDAWAAHSIDDYARIAASLARDVDTLVTLRRDLRPQFIDAGFPDGRRLSRSLEASYREMLADA